MLTEEHIFKKKNINRLEFASIYFTKLLFSVKASAEGGGERVGRSDSQILPAGAWDVSCTHL